MEDKLKTLIKTLPSVEPKKETLDRLVVKIVRREMQRLWEKRISILTAAASFFWGVAVVYQTIKVAKILGTTGFWHLLANDLDWWLKDYRVLWWAFLEANPLKEVASLVLLLAIFVFSLYILFRKDD